jgi:hypothetical protein
MIFCDNKKVFVDLQKQLNKLISIDFEISYANLAKVQIPQFFDKNKF